MRMGQSPTGMCRNVQRPRSRDHLAAGTWYTFPLSISTYTGSPQTDVCYLPGPFSSARSVARGGSGLRAEISARHSGVISTSAAARDGAN